MLRYRGTEGDDEASGVEVSARLALAGRTRGCHRRRWAGARQRRRFCAAHGCRDGRGGGGTAVRGRGVRGGARALCLCLRRAGPAEQLGPLRQGGRRLPRTAGASGSLCGGPGRGGPLSPPSLPSLPAAVPGRSAAPAGCHGEGRSRVAAAAAGLTRGGAGRAGGRVAAAATFRTPAAAAAAGAPMPGPTQALSPNGENNNDIIQDNGTIIPFRKHTVRGERSYRYCGGAAAARGAVA